MKTIRTGKVGDLTLRIVERNHAFVGLIFGSDSSKKPQIEGSNADDVWRRLHDEAGKAGPNYFGHDGARVRLWRPAALMLRASVQTILPVIIITICRCHV
jgi:hypothetical protein